MQSLLKSDNIETFDSRELKSLLYGKITPEISEAREDLEYFLENKALRRPDV